MCSAAGSSAGRWPPTCAPTSLWRRWRWHLDPRPALGRAGPPHRPGSQYAAIRYTDTLAAVGALASVGSTGDSYDNALAESTLGQIKAELVHRRGPWRTIEQLEFALFEYLDWWNHRRLRGEIGMIPPVEKEAAYHAQ